MLQSASGGGGGVPGPGGEGSAPRGGVPGLGGGVCSRGVSAPGGCLIPGGESALGGVCPGGCLLPGGRAVCSRGGVCTGGVCSQGGCLLWGAVGIPAFTEADTPPPCGQTHACENITLAQLCCGR